MFIDYIKPQTILFLFSLYVLLLPLNLFGQQHLQILPDTSQSLIADSLHRTDSESKKHGALRYVKNSAFKVGEELEFIIRYGPIMAGRARMSVPKIVNINEHPCYLITSEAWSNAFFSKFYRVEDKVKSYTDVDGIFSWRFDNKQHEGRWRDEHTVEFRQTENIAITTKDGKQDTVQVPSLVQDILSAMYFVRTQSFAPGDSIIIENHSNKKVIPVKILVHRRETVKVRAGKFKCLVVEPFLRTPRLFQQKGRVVVHLTDDDQKLPVLMTSQIYVSSFNLGNVVIELEKIKGVPGY